MRQPPEKKYSSTTYHTHSQVQQSLAQKLSLQNTPRSATKYSGGLSHRNLHHQQLSTSERASPENQSQKKLSELKPISENQKKTLNTRMTQQNTPGPSTVRQANLSFTRAVERIEEDLKNNNMNSSSLDLIK